MPTNVEMPLLGDPASPVTVRTWHVQADQRVARGQVLALIEQGSVSQQLTAPDAGTVESIHVPEGHSAPSGTLLLVLAPQFHIAAAIAAEPFPPPSHPPPSLGSLISLLAAFAFETLRSFLLIAALLVVGGLVLVVALVWVLSPRHDWIAALAVAIASVTHGVFGTVIAGYLALLLAASRAITRRQIGSQLLTMSLTLATRDHPTLAKSVVHASLTPQQVREFREGLDQVIEIASKGYLHRIRRWFLRRLASALIVAVQRLLRVEATSDDGIRVPSLAHQLGSRIDLALAATLIRAAVWPLVILLAVECAVVVTVVLGQKAFQSSPSSAPSLD